MSSTIKVKVKKNSAQTDEKSDNPTTSVEIAASEVAIFVKLSKDHVKLRKAHHQQVRADVCSAYKFGRRLLESQDLWDAFLKEDWEGIGRPDGGDQIDAVRYAIKFMVGPGKDAQKKASFYFRAIRKFAEADASVRKLKKALKKEGFRELAKKSAKTERREARDPVPKGGDVANSKNSVASWKGQDSEPKEARTKAAPASSFAEQAQSNRPSNTQNKPHKSPTMSLDWTPFECDVLLASKALKLTRMTDGQKLVLSCEFIASEPPGLRVMSIQKDES